jgi:hypothetical protein
MLSGNAALESRFGTLAKEWLADVVQARVPAASAFATLMEEAGAIRAAGRWVSGPADLLTVLGRHRDELFHSRLLGWLLNATAQHGLGDRFLRAFLDQLWPDEAVAAGGTVEIELERTQSGISRATGEPVEARADLVLRNESTVIVIENKLDAGEQPWQCERLYWAWAAEPTETRWLFLTPHGRRPTSVSSAEAISAWRTASYVDVHRALTTALGPSLPRATATGRASAIQYLATLERLSDQ